MNRARRMALLFWVGLILLTSTSYAGRWSQMTFRTNAREVFRRFGDRSADMDREFKILNFVAEKSVHVALFTVLGYLLWSAVPRMPQKEMLALILGLSVGVLSELMQGLFPDRDPTLRDVLLNVCGTVLGISGGFMRERVPSFSHKA